MNKKILKGTRHKDTRCTSFRLLPAMALTFTLIAMPVYAEPSQNDPASPDAGSVSSVSENPVADHDQNAGTAAFTSSEEPAAPEDTQTSPETADAQETDFTSAIVVTGQDVADFACQYVGNPYVWAGTSLTDGADCSGFVLSVYATFGIELPHFAASQAGYGTPVEYADLCPGDLLFYSWGGEISHVAIYIGDGQIVHAMNEANGICISQADYSPVACCRRLI